MERNSIGVRLRRQPNARSAMQASPPGVWPVFSRLTFGHPGRAASGAAYTARLSVCWVFPLRPISVAMRICRTLRRCAHRRHSYLALSCYDNYRSNGNMAQQFVGRGFTSRRKAWGNDQNGIGVTFAVARLLNLRVTAVCDKPPPYDMVCFFCAL